MKTKNNSLLRFFLLGLIAVLTAFAVGGPSVSASADVLIKKPQRQYVILGWNNLGMHCYNRDCSDLMVLPPGNTLWVQVIKVDNPPRIVTSGITVEYSFPDNTYSANKFGRPDKTNFWQYAQRLFGVSLAPNVGLAGKSLSGRMDLNGDHFEANFIPLTEYRDIDARPGVTPDSWKRYPYQTATIIVRDAATRRELARNIIVAPVSSELNCAMCHNDTGDATTRYPITPTGKVETNILTLHDYLNSGRYATPLMQSRPVLCANCHSSNALGKPGVQGISSLSNAMHNHHKSLPDITPDTNGCYNCHPGQTTQCLRDTMSQNFGLNCTTCHQQMADVAANPNPWLNEPRCDNAACHGQGFGLDNPLYRLSKGHGGIYCAGCHDSPHAIAPSRETNDSIKLAWLSANLGPMDSYRVTSLTQPSEHMTRYYGLNGNPGTLRDCSICHSQPAGNPFRHSNAAQQP